jgi:hypothetical protein
MPDGLDNLTGVRPETMAAALPEVEDISVVAPRPVGPISVSYVATVRPKLTWALPPGETGAIVEMCRVRTCKPKPEKSFAVTGSELLVPEDLATGVWFWRLRGRASGKVGLWPSATWELVLRGPAAHGGSTAPFGSMLDFDGDGIPEVAYATFDPGWGIDVELYEHGSDRAYGSLDSSNEEDEGFFRELSFAGGIDADGDGISDFVHSGLRSTSTKKGVRLPSVHVVPGRAEERESSPEEPEVETMGADPIVPSVATIGDFDGDGYGDVLVGKDRFGFLVRGRKPGAVKLTSEPSAPVVQPGSTPFFHGTFDLNEDGLADLLYASENGLGLSMGVAVAAWEHESRQPTVLAPASAVAAATGDFDGDGRADTAVTASGKICFWFGSATGFRSGPCLPIPADVLEFGASLAAGALDGGGRDQLLATYKKRDQSTGVFVVTPDGVSGAPLAVGYGAAVTTIWMGRPGQARWATTSPEGKGLAIFEGTVEVHTLEAEADDKYARAIR